MLNLRAHVNSVNTLSQNSSGFSVKKFKKSEFKEFEKLQSEQG